ncbi:MAG: hypothetical protein ACHQM4_05585 [Thermoanaerobaculia bacterium]
MRIRHYWRKHLAQNAPLRVRAVTCDAAGTLALVSREPQEALGWFSRLIALLTTPFKRIGISGWKETGCAGEGNGRPMRDAQHSTDGFYTIDLALEALTIGPEAAPAGRYLRLEVEPGTRAHEVCAEAPVRQGTLVTFGGALVIDTDGPFLEIHPDERFAVG